MKPAFPINGPWPRLTDELPLYDPRECAQCGSGRDLHVWQEHDLTDAPEPLYLVLCQRCSDAVIEKHPRLYRCMVPNEPAPGVMPICLECVHRAGSRCEHPQSRLRGGRGVKLEYPSPLHGMIDYRGKGGRREGGPISVYPGIVFNCSGKELARNFVTA